MEQENNNKEIRLNKVAKELNVGVSTIVDFLQKKGQSVENNPNHRISMKQYEMLVKEFSSDIILKKQMEKEAEKEKERKKAISAENKAKKQAEKNNDTNQVPNEKKEVKVLGKIDLEQSGKNGNPKPQSGGNNQPKQEQNNKNTNQQNQKKQQQQQQQQQKNTADAQSNFKVLGKIDLNTINTKTRPDKKSKSEKQQEREQRQRDREQNQAPQPNNANAQPKNDKPSEKKPLQTTVVNTPAVEKDKSSVNDNVASNVSTPEVEKNVEKEDVEIFNPSTTKLAGLTVIGKMELPLDEPKKGKRSKRKRKRIEKERVDINAKETLVEGGKDKSRRKDNKNKDKDKDKDRDKSDKESKSKDRKNSDKNFDRSDKKGGQKDGGKQGRHKDKDRRFQAPEITEEDVNKQVKETFAKIQSGKGKTKSSIRRKERREEMRAKEEEVKLTEEREKKTLKVTEFVTANELATLMDVHVNQIIATCFDLGTAISINQRLDAEIISVVASEFGFDVNFVDMEEEDDSEEEEDKPEDMQPRPPIVTIMGHVDHGKTSLLDYIRKTNVIAGEAGGITQHIGAYNVEMSDGKHITFLDTPGHEAFTAMRARGAKITDIAVIVIAADDSIMPQTEEAISHAQAAGVPIIFAINKIDKPGANPEKIKEALANKNLLIEEWGGKYGSVDISAKKGLNVDKLLERILLEAEMLELKANYKKRSTGSIIEASLDKGRGYVATVIVETGILRTGDVICAGSHSGKIKAMFNERGKKIKEAKPSEPALILGLDGAPSAGDKFKVMPDERTAREKATKRGLLEREIGHRTQKHLTLEEIGRRIAIGSFQELNIIIKGDVQGTIEALQDSLEGLSTEEIQVKVIQKAVGQISESDVLLASASNAVIIGFQVRPSSGAKKLAEKEQIDIKLYSIIYDAIDDIKKAMEGMLSPEVKEEITGTAEVQQLFRISKVGTIAGCIVKEGKIFRNNKCRVIRDGIVIHTGELESLKRFKDDAKEVTSGQECGLNIAKFNDMQVGDIIESYEEKEISRTLNTPSHEFKL